MSHIGDDGLNEIKSHWKNMALSSKDKNGLRPTARDPYLQNVVESAIEPFLYPGAKLLDIGCGDGLSTIRFAKTTGYALGIDYLEEFIARAQTNAMQSEEKNIIFEQGNVLDLEKIRERFGLFNIILTIRCLINLPDWTHQAAAIDQIAQTVSPGGFYIASEGWEEGLAGLNIFRQRLQLPLIEAAKYNCFMSRRQFEEQVTKYFIIVKYINLGLYLFLSRIIQPLFVSPEPPSHTHHLNKIAADIVNSGVSDAAFEYCDYCGLYLLRRHL